LGLALLVAAGCSSSPAESSLPPEETILERDVGGYAVTVKTKAEVICVRTETNQGVDERCAQPGLGPAGNTAFSAVEVAPGIWSVGQVRLDGDLRRLEATSSEGAWEAIDEEGAVVLWVEAHGDLETVKIWRLEDPNSRPWTDAWAPF
jgi:hypothetical protein